MSALISEVAFALEKQKQDNWCWAAVGTSVKKFFSQTSTMTQCSLAGEFLRRDCCTGTIVPGDACDKKASLREVLDHTHNLNIFRSTIMNIPDIRTELSKGRPVPVRIRWGAGPSSHFVVVTRVGPDSPLGEDSTMVVVKDPSQSAFGVHEITYATLKAGYRGSGNWTHSYLVQK